MKLKKLRLLSTCILLCVASPLKAKEWRGLVPLHSSREDVERLLGVPNRSGKYTSSYELELEIVSFIYASGGPCGSDATNSWKVPQDTIVDITVAPKQKLLFSALNLRKEEYKKSEDPTVEGHFYYTNEGEGIRYSIQKTPQVPDGIVMNVNYWPAAKDSYLRCLAQRGESKRTDYAPFEDYGNIAFNDEKPRLDNFAIQLQHDPELLGYIVVYAGRYSREGEAQRRAKRAKRYIVNMRGTAPARVVTIDGGYRETLTTELYLLQRHLPPPTGKPTPGRNEARTIRIRQSRKSTLGKHGAP